MKNTFEVNQNNNERLTEDEALLYQEYASKIEGKEFSDKANESSYLEAEKLIEKLHNKDFDWLKIDWDKIDFSDLGEISSMERRLDDAVRLLADKGEVDDSFLNKFVQNSKGIVLPLAISVALLLSSIEAKGQELDDFLNKYTTLNTKEYSHDYQRPFKIEGKISSYLLADNVDNLAYNSLIDAWAQDNSDKINNIEMIYIDSEEDGFKMKDSDNGTSDYSIFDVNAKIKIIILTKDKKARIIEGDYSGQEVMRKLDDAEAAEVAQKYHGDHGVTRGGDVEFLANAKALQDALNKI